MHKLKKLLKKVLPKTLLQPLLNPFHLLEAIIANVRYGFPGHSAQVIMITGTNGKTTTAVILARILEAAGYKVGVSSTALYKVGEEEKLNDQNMTTDNVFKVQKLLARMKQAKCDYIIMEVTSHALVQHRVWGIPCDVAVMTNLTQDHLNYHGTMERYAAAKGKMFKRHPRLIVLNRDDQWFDYFNKFAAKERKVTYGAHEDATSRLTDVTLHPTGSDVTLRADDMVDIPFHTDLLGKFNVYNATAAATTAHFLQIDPDKIAEGIANVHNVPGRLERIDEGQNFTVLVDYAHTPDAMQNVLETLRHLTKGKLRVVFGATGNRDKSTRPMMGEITVNLADKVYLTDDEPYDEVPATIRSEVMRGVENAKGQSKTTEYDDRRDAILAAIKESKKGDVVIIAGMGHEQFRVIKGERLPWSDGKIAKEALQQK